MAKVWIPAERFVALLDKHNVTPSQLGEVGAKRVGELRRGAQEAISLDGADRILTRLGLAHWFHVPEDQGGFADIYEADDETYEPEWLERRREQLKTIRRTPMTPEQRRERALVRQARYAAKRKKPCPDCGMPASGTRCQGCRTKYVEAQHGSVSRYAGPRQCRCDLCKTASSEYHRERRRKMKADYQGRAA